MRRRFGDREVWLTVISTGRPQAEPELTQLIGRATWYVRASDDYPAAMKRREAPDGVSRARNAALDDAHEQGLPCVQVSDDLTRMAVLEDGKAVTAGFRRIVGLALYGLADTGAKLAGAAPTANPFFGKERVHQAAFIVGDFIVVEPTPLRFDERLRLKEDYDYTLQHLRRYGCVARNDRLLLTFRHRTNAGGAVSDRTAAREQEAIAILRETWGDAIRDNPKRENEILLNAAKALA